MTSYIEVVNYILRTYVTKEVIREVDAVINHLLRGYRVTPLEYGQELWSKAHKCGTEYEEGRLKCIFIEVLQDPMQQRALNYLGKNPEADLQELAQNA